MFGVLPVPAAVSHYNPLPELWPKPGLAPPDGLLHYGICAMDAVGGHALRKPVAVRDGWQRTDPDPEERRRRGA